MDAILERSRQAFVKWRHSPSHERAALLRLAESRLRERRAEFEKLIIAEARKPVALARAEVDRALFVLDWAAAEAPRFGGELLRLDAARTGRAGFGIHARAARGPVLGITPFNFPLNLVIHKVAPAVACGCPIVIKPSPHVPGVADAAARLFEGGPEGLVQVARVSDEETARMTSDPRVATVSFTGSARVGWQVRRQAYDKPVTLELGGNAWVIVTEDLDRGSIRSVAARIAGAAFGYAGQSCISVQNVAVAEPLWEEFSRELREATRAFAWGDPARDDVTCGPVIDESAAARIEGIIAAAGAALPAGSVTRAATPRGAIDPADRAYVPPCLVEIADPIEGPALPFERELVDEEIFGPVMTARPYRSLDAVVARINAGPYGLQAGVYTDRLSVAERLYRDLVVGGLVVNDVPNTRYDHQPYGGVKRSGLGREGIRYAMEEMTEPRFLSLSTFSSQ